MIRLRIAVSARQPRAAHDVTSSDPRQTDRPRSAKSTRKKAVRPKAGARRAALTLDELAALVPVQPFKIAEFAVLIDRPVRTARASLGRLEQAGTVHVVSVDRSGRGLPAKVYEKV